MKTKFPILLTLVLILASLSLGYLWGHHNKKLQTLQTVAENYKRAYNTLPENYRNDLEKLVGNMSKAEIDEMMTQIKNFSRTAVIELNQMELFKAYAAIQLETCETNGGKTALDECSASFKNNFLKSYNSQTTDYGDCQKIADALAKRLTAESQQTPQN